METDRPENASGSNAPCLAMSVVNASRVKEAAEPYRVSHHFYAALEQRMLAAIHEAKRRAEANGRTTLMPQDV